MASSTNQGGVPLTTPRSKTTPSGQTQDERNSQYTEIQPPFEPPRWAQMIRSLWFKMPEWIRWFLWAVWYGIKLGLWALLAAVLATFPGIFSMFIGNIICEVTKQPYFSNIGEAMAIGLLGSVFLTGIFFVLGSIFADASFGSIAPPITFWLISIFLWCLVSGPFGRVAVKDCQLSSFDTFRVAAIGGAVFTLVTMMIIVPAFIGLIFVCTYIKRCLQAKPFVRGDASGYKWLTSQFSWCGCGRPMCNDENV